MDIIIIDDSKMLRERLKAELEKFPGIVVAGEGESLTQTKQLLEKISPDVIFLDIRLMDGVSVDLIPILKSYPNNPVVIVLTNYPYPQYRSRCLEAGADYFLEKKTEFTKIPDIMQALVNGTRQ